MWSKSSVLGFLLSAWITNAQRAPSIQDSQDLQGPEFVGHPASPNPLFPKVQFQPATAMMHGDSGNTGSTDYQGPLGNSTIGSTTEFLAVMMWGADGTLFGVRIDDNNPGEMRLGLGAYNSDLEILAEWFPPNSSETLNPSYMQLILEDTSIVVSTQEGRIFVVDYLNSQNNTSFALHREIDVRNALQPGQSMLNAMSDGEGNIWFTTGSLFAGQQFSAMVGYVEPDETLHTLDLPGQIIENGMAVNGTRMYTPTSPPRNDSSANATGYMWAFTTSPDDQNVTVLWSTPYNAGSGLKRGLWSRGSGTTPSFLGDDYVIITDNTDGQVNQLVFHRDPQPGPEDQVFCKIPLFEEGLSGTSNKANTHFDGTDYSLAILNTFNAPERMPDENITNSSINESWNDRSEMPGGLTRIDVTQSGCSTRWDSDLKMITVPVLSTATGILYGYTQDVDLAADGSYVWYVVAIDWKSGEILWKQRTGAGGAYNDNWAPAAISPEGRFYQPIARGTVWVEDRPVV